MVLNGLRGDDSCVVARGSAGASVSFQLGHRAPGRGRWSSSQAITEAFPAALRNWAVVKSDYWKYLFGGGAPRVEGYPRFAATWPPAALRFARAVIEATDTARAGAVQLRKPRSPGSGPRLAPAPRG
jgi:hypothetical protein